jgi:hypothetical protein
MSRYDFKSDPRLVLDLARERLKQQISFGESLDSKIATLFAAGSALIGILAAILSLARDDLDGVSIVLLFVAASAYVLVTIVAAVASWPQRLRVGPSVDWAWDRSQEVSDDQFLPELISGYMDYWRRNRTRNFVKAFALRAGYVAILVETVCLLAAIAVVSH